MTITAIHENNSSVKLDYLPVPGAVDYRVFYQRNRHMVKYAGTRHLFAGLYCNCHFVLQADGVTPVYPYTTTANTVAITQPTRLDVPSTQIELNLIADGSPHYLVVQAVDRLGPVPPANLYPGMATTGMTTTSMGMVGSNEGKTPDGMFSINGQGPPDNNPVVLAESKPVMVVARPTVAALPSRPDALQTMFDTFDPAEAATLQRVGTVDPSAGVMTYTLNAGTPKAWTVQYQNADTTNSMPMIENGHFMDVLLDGGTPGSNIPLHEAHGVVAMSPVQTADLSGGRLLHLTMEVDAHIDSRRWLAFNLAPADDPLTNWYNANSAINTTNRAFFAQLFPGSLSTDVFTGTAAGGQTPTGSPITGAAGQAPIWGFYDQNWGGNGLGLDNRSRLDLFVTHTHFALFEDGQFVIEADIPGGLPFDKVKVYFTHYLYHTGNDHPELMTSQPWETYWITQFPWSDERHWDNMGFEVLPPAAVPTDWHALGTLITMP